MTGAGTANGATPRRAQETGRARRELLSFAELFAASGLAVAQPLFDVASKNSELFSTRHVSGPGLVAIVLAVILVPPLVLLGLEVLVGLVIPRARRSVHAVLVGGLLGVWAMAVAKHATDLGVGVLIGIGIVSALAAIALVLRVALVATFLRVLAFAPLLFALLFLFDSSVGTVVFDANAQAATVAVAHPHRVVWVVLDELPLTSLLDGTGHVDAELFPNFAALGGAVDVVPRHHDGRAVHARRRSGTPHRADAEAGAGTGRPGEPSPQRVHAARWRVRHARPRDADRALPGRTLPGRQGSFGRA